MWNQSQTLRNDPHHYISSDFLKADKSKEDPDLFIPSTNGQTIKNLLNNIPSNPPFYIYQIINYRKKCQEPP